MKADKVAKIVSKFDWEISKQQRFLGLVMRAQSMKGGDEILKGACWIDGTIETQIKFAREKAQRLIRAREKFIRKIKTVG